MNENQEIKQEKVRLKNLASCKPTEFVKQTAKIKNSVSKFMKATNFMEIVTEKAQLTGLTDLMTEEEKQAAFDQNKNMTSELKKKKISKLLDAMLEEHPAETLELLALCCFVEPDKVDDYKMSDYFSALFDMLNDTATMSFFISLVQLAKQSI